MFFIQIDMRLITILLICLSSTLFAQQITTVTPDKGERGQTLNLQITGSQTNFTQASSIMVSIFNAATVISANSVSVLSNTQLTANITIPNQAAFQWCDVAVSGMNIPFVRKASAFAVVNSSGKIPKLNSFTPASATAGQTLDLTITGSNTLFTQASQVTASFYTSASAISVNQVDVINDTTVVTNISVNNNAGTGFYPFYLQSGADGRLYSPGLGLFVGQSGSTPQLVNVTPSAIGTGETLDLTITGMNVDFTQGSGVVSVSFFNGATYLFGSATSVVSPIHVKTTLTAPTDLSYLGFYDVIVSKGDTDLVLQDGLSLGIAIGLKELQKEYWQVFPNPVREELTVTTDMDLSDFGFMNLSGQVIQVRPEDVTRLTEGFKIRTSQYKLVPGLYLLRAWNKDKFTYHKIIVE